MFPYGRFCSYCSGLICFSTSNQRVATSQMWGQRSKTVWPHTGNSGQKVQPVCLLSLSQYNQFIISFLQEVVSAALVDDLILLEVGERSLMVFNFDILAFFFLGDQKKIPVKEKLWRTEESEAQQGQRNTEVRCLTAWMRQHGVDGQIRKNNQTEKRRKYQVGQTACLSNRQRERQV